MQLITLLPFLCAHVHVSLMPRPNLWSSPCCNSIKHASIDIKRADTSCVDPRQSLCVELGCQGLVDANRTKLGGTIVHQTADTKQPSTRGHSDNVAMVLVSHRRKEGLDCLKAGRRNYNTNVVGCSADTILSQLSYSKCCPYFITESQQLHYHVHACVYP